MQCISFDVKYRNLVSIEIGLDNNHIQTKWEHQLYYDSVNSVEENKAAPPIH